MKLSLRLILLTEASVSPSMARIIKQAKEFERKESKFNTPQIVLPAVLTNLLKLRKSGFKASDAKLKKALEKDIIRIKSTMIKLGLTLPKELDTPN